MEEDGGRETIHLLKHTLNSARAAGTGHCDVEFVVVRGFHFLFSSVALFPGSFCCCEMVDDDG